MLLSPEIEAKLRKDNEFLRSCAGTVIQEMSQNFGYTQEDFRKDFGTGSLVSQWVTGENLPNPESSWAILELADEGYVPIEAIIRGKVLDEFNVVEKISRMRTFIVEAVKRLDEDGSKDEDGILRVELVVQQGELSWFGLISDPGPSRIWVGLAIIGEKLIFDFCKLGKSDVTTGGVCDCHLPLIPEDLDEHTLPIHDPHYSHEGTIRDWEENTRWVREGKIVDQGFHLDCSNNAMREVLGITK